MVRMQFAVVGRLLALNLIVALTAVTTGGLLNAEEALRVLTAEATTVPPAEQLHVYLKQQAIRQLDDRLAAFAELKSLEDHKRWQAERRQFFIDQIGGFPERTPLNAKLVGQLSGEGYRIEKILFESRPGHHVTGNLYLPAPPRPQSADLPGLEPALSPERRGYPAVLVPCGHSHNGKAAGAYQRMCILLAKNGMAAFCYDPVGQGERYQMLDFDDEHTHFVAAEHVEVPHPRVQYLCTTEHTAMGLGSILLGSNIAQFRIWDGIRAIDYLQSREDIDPERIGCTGNSGGGTLTAYLMALDDRIAVAAPVCYLTTFRQLLETRGPQDAEQNIFGQLAFGMDEPDYMIMRAPKPTLIGAGRRDVTFSIDGTWDLFRQSKQFYARLGYPERVDLNDADLPHGFYLQQREAVARWMHRWLVGEDKVIHEIEPHLLPDPLTDEHLRTLNEGDWTQEELYCSPAGQVLLMPGEKSVFEINAETEASLRARRDAAWEGRSEAERRQLVRAILNDFPPAGEDAPEAGEAAAPAAPQSHGRVERDGYHIEKLSLEVEPGLRLPALAFYPAHPTGRATLYLHGESMQADAAVGGGIESLVNKGQLVLAAELRGIGETETGRDKPDYARGYFGPDVQDIFLAYLIGRSYVGMRTGDVTGWARVLEKLQADLDLPDESQREPLRHLIAIGEAAIPALHAAALEPDRFDAVRLHNGIESWAELVRSPEPRGQAANVVHGALLHYDLPHLMDLVGPTKVKFVRTSDAVAGERAGQRPPGSQSSQP